MTKFDTYKNAFPHAKLTRSPEGCRNREAATIDCQLYACGSDTAPAPPGR